MPQRRDGGSKTELLSANIVSSRDDAQSWWAMRMSTNHCKMQGAGKLNKDSLRRLHHPIFEYHYTPALVVVALPGGQRLRRRRTTVKASSPSHLQTHHMALSRLRPCPTMRAARPYPLETWPATSSPISGLRFGRHLLYSMPTLTFCRLGTLSTATATALSQARYRWTFSLFRIRNRRRQPCRTTLPSAS